MPVVEDSGKVDISIHALREEGDRCIAVVCGLFGLISIHALREEGDNSNLIAERVA